MSMVIDALSWLAILGGLFFMIVGTIGVLRLPDVFTRGHAAGMTDTLGAGLLILGMCLQAGFGLLLVRLILLYAFLAFTSPIASHCIAKAALSSGVKPILSSGPREG